MSEEKKAALALDYERAAFEKLIVEKFGHFHTGGELVESLTRPGEYSSPSTQLAWEMWQARAESTPNNVKLDDSRDAARYRWIRSGHICIGRQTTLLMTGSALDDSIDEAMTTANPENLV